jgi:competence protein ComEC
LIFARYLPISSGIAAGVFAAALIACGIALLFFKQANVVRQLALFAACILLGVFRFALVEVQSPDAVERFADKEAPVILAGEVMNVPLSGKPLATRLSRKDLANGVRALPDTLWRYTLSARGIFLSDENRWQPVGGKVIASGTQIDSLEIGEQVVLPGDLVLPDGERNPGDFNHREFLSAQGITALLRCRNAEAILRQPADGFNWRKPLQVVREAVARQIHQFSSGDNASLLLGLLLGERAEISDDVRDAFVRTGLVHILAVSGSHVGFVLLIVLALGDALRLSQVLKSLFAGVALIFFAALTGFNPPVTRATIMALIFLGGRLIERNGNSYNMLALAALIILFGEPRQLFQLGFQLSFAAVLGMVYLYAPMIAVLNRSFAALVKRWPILDKTPDTLKRAGRAALAVLAISIAAQLATAPIIAHAFGRVPALAIWGNIPVIPLAFWVVASTTVACAIMPFWKFGGAAFGAAADFGAGLMLDFIKWLAGTPGAYVDGIKFSLAAIVLFTLAVIIVVEWRSPIRRFALPAFLVVANFVMWRDAIAEPVKVRATFFDIGQGDAALVEFAGGRRMLIDAGPAQPGFDAGSRTIVPFLMRQGIRHLDAIIITHPHNDHDGGVPAVLRSVKVDTVYDCGKSPPYSEITRVSDSLNVPQVALHAGRSLRQFAPEKIFVLHPPQEVTAPSTNDASVVLRIICGKKSFLFTGDAEIWGETQMERFAKVLDSDVLKVGHHGSRTSSSPEFVERISPTWAVVSVGKRNRFDHPNREVMQRLKASGAQVVRLDENGAAIFCTDGEKIWRER